VTPKSEKVTKSDPKKCQISQIPGVKKCQIWGPVFRIGGQKVSDFVSKVERKREVFERFLTRKVRF